MTNAPIARHIHLYTPSFFFSQVPVPIRVHQHSISSTTPSVSSSARIHRAKPSTGAPSDAHAQTSRPNVRQRRRANNTSISANRRSNPAIESVTPKIDSGIRAKKEKVWSGPCAYVMATTSEEKTGNSPQDVHDQPQTSAHPSAAKSFLQQSLHGQASPSTHSLHSSASIVSLSSPHPPTHPRVPQPQSHPQAGRLTLEASISLFANSHHFDALAVPPAPQPLTQPVIFQTNHVRASSLSSPSATSLTHTNANRPLDSHRTSQTTLHPSHSLPPQHPIIAPSSSASRLVYDTETSSLRQVPSATQLDPNHSPTSASPSTSSPLLSGSSSLIELKPQASGEKHYFSPEWSQSSTNLHMSLPKGQAPHHQQLFPSASVGALPIGISPSESHATLYTRPSHSLHVQSTPTIPRLSLPTNPSDSTTSLHSPPASYYPPEHTIDNRLLIASALKDLIRSKGYHYRTRGVGGEVLEGQVDESSDGEEGTLKRREKKKAKANKSNGKNKSADANETKFPSISKSTPTDAHGYPRPSWDKGGFESLSANLPFHLLFGEEDAATKLKRKKRAARVEASRMEIARHTQSMNEDNEQAQRVIDGGGAITTRVTRTSNVRGATSDTNGSQPDGHAHPSNVLVPTDLVGVTTQSLHSTSSTRPVDPLQPHPRPTLLAAAARVLLRKELHPPTIDANQIRIETANIHTLPAAVKPSRPKGVLDLLAAKTSIDSDESPMGNETDGQLVLAGGSDLDVTDPAHSHPRHGRGSHSLMRHASLTSHSSSHTNRALKSNMESWLRNRARRHAKLLKEEDRLRAREMFDMLLIAANGASGHGIGSGSKSARHPSTHPQDPSTATIELDAMRRALKSLGMESSMEELAFRLQKLSQHHAALRANAQAGIGTSKNATNGSQSAREHSTTSTATSSIHLTFTDFLEVYNHISQWDELATYKRLKDHQQQQALSKDGSQSHRSNGATTRRTNSMTDDAIVQRTRKALTRSSSSTSTSATTAASNTVAPFSLEDSLPIGSTRTDDNLRKIELPFFLWIPAAHRAERINEMIRLYGQPSQVGVGIGFDEKEKDTKTLDDALGKNLSSSMPSGRHGRALVPTSSKSSLRSAHSSRGRKHRKQRLSLMTPTTAAMLTNSIERDEALALMQPSDEEDSSSSEDDQPSHQPQQSEVAGPKSIVRTLVDTLKGESYDTYDGLRTTFPPLASSSSASAPGLSPLKRRNTISSTKKSKSKSHSNHSPASGLKQSSVYWGSQQVMRALHFKNLSLSSSTLQTNRILTHETVAPSSSILSNPATPSMASRSFSSPTPKRQLFVPPLTGGAVSPTIGHDSIPEVDTPIRSSTPTSVTTIVNGRRVSTPVRNLQRAMHAKADETQREINEFIKQVEANLAKQQSIEQEALLEAENEQHRVEEKEGGQAQSNESKPMDQESENDASPNSKKKSSKNKKKLSPPSKPLQVAIPTSPPTLAHARNIIKTIPVPVKEIETATLPTSVKLVSKAQDKVDDDRVEVMPLTDPIIKAAKNGAWEDVLMLIQTTAGDDVKLRTAYVNRRDKNGSSAIFHCAWPGHYKVMEVLLYHGADPNITNNRLNTALHLCTEKGHRKLIRLLIEMGASIELRNWQNKTCLDVIPLEEVEQDSNTITVVPAGSTAIHQPTPAAIDKAMKSHAAADASDSLKSFVLECAAEAKRKKEAEKAENGGLGTVTVSSSSVGGDFSSFTDYTNRRDAAAAASLAAQAAAEASLSLLGPDGKPAVDLWELTAADRRSAGIRGSFFGADALQEGGQAQARTLTGELLIHAPESATGITANKNAMAAYKASFISLNNPLAQETRARIVAGLVREELSRSSLHELWIRTQKKVANRKTVISSTEDLLKQNGERMEELRRSRIEREQRMIKDNSNIRLVGGTMSPINETNTTPSTVANEQPTASPSSSSSTST